MASGDIYMEIDGESDYDERAEKEETQIPTQNGSQSSDDHVTVIFKDCHDLYIAAKTGNRDDFSETLNEVSAAEHASSDDILHGLGPARNTFLHIATKFGKEDIVKYICEKDPSLLLHKNSGGETPLHLAAKRGHVLMVKTLVDIHKFTMEFHNLEDVFSSSEEEENNEHEAEENNADGLSSSDSSSIWTDSSSSWSDSSYAHGLSSNEAEENNLLSARNKKGNTALHEALINGRESIAEYLIQEDPEVSFYRNTRGESALYLAAKAGFVECVAMILRSSTDKKQINKLFKKRSPFEAAVMGKHRGVLEAMLNINPSLRDSLGRTPLHYAASLGYLEEVLHLLGKYPSSATQRDRSDSLPIHLASINGHVDIIKVLPKDFPHAEEHLNKDGRNILHLAASKGRYNVVRYILNNPLLTDLINMKDERGDTPLHLAASHWHLQIVFDFTWDKRVDVMLVNNRGLTALDYAEMCERGKNPTFRQRLTCDALKAAGVPRSVSLKTGYRKYFTFSMEKYKDRVHTFLLMSTLVATITFAAGFTLPGGYNSSSDTNLGITTMLREKGFDVFIFCDAMAMHTSIIVAVALIWAQLGNPSLVLNALTLTAPLLGVALGMMSVAFTAGVFLAVSKLRWLSIAVLVMGITFIAILFVLLIPLCVPLASSNRIYRYISYYPFYLVILASSSWPRDELDDRPPPTRAPALYMRRPPPKRRM